MNWTKQKPKKVEKILCKSTITIIYYYLNLEDTVVDNCNGGFAQNFLNLFWFLFSSVHFKAWLNFYVYMFGYF
jgi:hypothetical protein